jgi:uncharacterized protein YgiB involved in biofilm formation
MTEKNDRPEDLQPRPIRRKIVYASLSIAAIIAIPMVVSNCNNEIAEKEANEPINALFYRDTAECEADISRQQAEYPILEKKFQAGELTKWPEPPPLKVTDCAPQMLAAQQEHAKTAPIYGLIADCQAEGVQCEATPAGEQTAGYRPVYGGTYIEPVHDFYAEPRYIYTSGYQYRVYENRTVYQSITPGRIVTPYGREISQTTTGRVTVPRHTTFTAPARPAGTAGRGTIRGRSSQGFGSSFKSTGRGGK